MTQELTQAVEAERHRQDIIHPVPLEARYEFFTAETKEEQLKEAVQNIAFWVRIHEYIINN